MKNLSAILQAFRTDIPNSSLTAQAIDRGALLEEISQVAAIDLETLINNQIRQLRTELPDESRTAKAIDRGATWEEFPKSAQEEGLGNLAATLFEAEQEKGKG